MSTFIVGQYVTANTTAQGMTKGETYRVTDLHTFAGFGGVHTDYEIEATDGTRLAIGNGFLVLRDATYIEALVAFLNGSHRFGFIHHGVRITTADVNRDGAGLVAEGRILETPGDPYTWAVAPQAAATA